MLSISSSLIGPATMLAQADFGPDPNAAAGGGMGMMVMLLVELAIFLIVVAGLWKVFEKAGKPGWAAIIPIYNIVVMLEIVGKPIWWLLLFFIPCVNFIIALIVSLEMAKVFGKGAGFGIGLWLLPFIFYPVLGFSDAQYTPPANAA